MTEEVKFWEDTGPQEVPENQMEALQRYAEESSELKAAIAKLEDELELKKERLRVVITDLIPGIMQEMNVTELKLDSKVKIVVQPKVKASITKVNEKQAFDWLVKNKFGGLIKSSVVAEFPRDEIEQAREVVAALQEDGIDAALKESVHPQTLNAFVSERLEEGQALPECFSVFEYREAKITLPKVKK